MATCARDSLGAEVRRGFGAGTHNAWARIRMDRISPVRRSPWSSSLSWPPDATAITEWSGILAKGDP